MRFLFHAGTSFHRISSCLLASCCFCKTHKKLVRTRSPAVARDGRTHWPSRKTVIPSGIGLAPSWELDNCPDWLSWSFIDWLPSAYCPSTLYRATLAVINNACLLTCDTSRTNSDQHPQFICSHMDAGHMDAGYYNFGRRLSRYVGLMQTNKHLQFI